MPGINWKLHSRSTWNPRHRYLGPGCRDPEQFPSQPEKRKVNGITGTKLWAETFRLDALGFTSGRHARAVEFGCGYGTFTVPAPRIADRVASGLGLCQNKRSLVDFRLVFLQTNGGCSKWRATGLKGSQEETNNPRWASLYLEKHGRGLFFFDKPHMKN